jgi:hypothetical protein
MRRFGTASTHFQTKCVSPSHSRQYYWSNTFSISQRPFLAFQRAQASFTTSSVPQIRQLGAAPISPTMSLGAPCLTIIFSRMGGVQRCVRRAGREAMGVGKNGSVGMVASGGDGEMEVLGASSDRFRSPRTTSKLKKRGLFEKHDDCVNVLSKRAPPHSHET